MIDEGCPASGDELLSWWLGELEGAEAERIEEHLFACGRCAARLQRLIGIGEALRDTIRRGDVGFVASAPLVRRMKEAGLTVREYTLEAGGSVSCTIAPGDDFVVAHLHAPLGDVRRLDLIFEDRFVGTQRMTDVAFDRQAGELTMVPSAAMLRSLGHEQQRVRLVAVEAEGERVLGDYTFNHHPFRPGT
jgi:anti-sigma factor RsiW